MTLYLWLYIFSNNKDNQKMSISTENKEGHVYLLRAVGTNRYKIGMTQLGRMQKRFEELSGSQAAFPVELITFIDVSDRHQVEAELHQKFKAHRVHGEWFALDRGKAREVEREMSRYETSARSTGENWRYLSFIAGIVCLLLAWQSYQGDRVRQQLPGSYVEQGD